MSIQLYEDGRDDAGASNQQALVVLPNGLQITEEEHEKRIKDEMFPQQQALLQAEELEEKLKFITEKVPTRIMNVSGSNAGAGSGEFHMYRMARRREQMRLQRIDEQQKEEEADKEFREKREKQREADEARASKRRALREKKKRKKGGSTEGSAVSIASLNTAAQEDEAQAGNTIEGLPDID